jgi:hypothetical protein
VKRSIRGSIQVIGLNVESSDDEETDVSAGIDEYKAIRVENEAFKDEGMSPDSLFVE